MTERYTRSNFGHVQIEVSYEDPGAFERPLSASLEWRYAVDEVMLETVCAEAYSGDHGNWTSDVSEVQETTVELAPELLARLVGRYEGEYLGAHFTMEVTLEDGELYLRNGNAFNRMEPQSETAFLVGGLGYLFTVDDRGVATTMSRVHVSGAWPFTRVPD